MYTERLLLQVEASRVGWNVITPPVVKGASGASHPFSFLASSGNLRYGFDIYEKVSEVEVLKSYIKELDTKASVQIVTPGNAVSEGARRLARDYGIKVLAENEVHSFFEEALLRMDPEAVRGLRLTT